MSGIADKQTAEWLDYQAVGWRRLAYLGSRFGPSSFVKYSPSAIGVGFGLLSTRQRRAVKENLRRLLGPRSRFAEERDVFRTFATYAHCLAESLGAERQDAQAAHCEVRNQSALDELLRSDSGFVIGTAHTGGWDIAAQCLLTHAKRRILLVMDREEDSRAMALHDSIRAGKGIEIAHVGADELEGLLLLRHLKQGGIVAMQLDRVLPGSRSIEVQLGRGPFSLPLGPFVLAALTQVPLLPLFVARRGYYSYDVRIGEAHRLPRPMSEVEQRKIAGVVARELEAFLLEFPEQWFNFAAKPPKGAVVKEA